VAMETDENKRRRHRAAYVANETGITPGEALDLIGLLGMDLGVLLREARFLKKQKDRKL
jgi:hypothetical protein